VNKKSYSHSFSHVKNFKISMKSTFSKSYSHDVKKLFTCELIIHNFFTKFTKIYKKITKIKSIKKVIHMLFTCYSHSFSHPDNRYYRYLDHFFTFSHPLLLLLTKFKYKEKRCI